jgi:hypothetical protein
LGRAKDILFFSNSQCIGRCLFVVDYFSLWNPLKVAFLINL